MKIEWDVDDLENITSVGHKQCISLGEWFNRYLKSRNLAQEKEKVFWRCSKSGRAKESGVDFISGFNKERVEVISSFLKGLSNNFLQLISNKPEPYVESADNYFRPWKVYTEFTVAMKSRMASSPVWAEKALENQDFLVRVFSQTGAAGVTAKITKALWSTTYLYCVRECEEYWPSTECGKREALRALLQEDDWIKVTELACWVWEERFVRSGFVYPMGGKLASEIISVSFVCYSYAFTI